MKIALALQAALTAAALVAPPAAAAPFKTAPKTPAPVKTAPKTVKTPSQDGEAEAVPIRVPGATPAAAPEGQHVAGEVGERVDAYLSRLQGLGFSGGALVVADGEVALSKGYGFADREAEVAFTTDTLFPNGSITKPFTGTLVVKLQTEGLLDFEDTLADHFEDVPADKQGITVHHLLTHGAGLTESLGYDFDAIGRDEYVTLALASPLSFEPGTGYAYSNVGFSLLAALVEQVTGQAYTDALEQRLLAPAGMERTTYRLADYADAELACGYRGEQDFGRMRDHGWGADGPSWHLLGNGGLHTTLRDTYRWHVALLDDTLLPHPARARLFAPHNDEGGGRSFYGYGWVRARSPRGTTVIQHDGGNPYFSSDLRRYVDEDALVFVHSNTGDMAAYTIAPMLERIVFGEDVALPPAVGAHDDGVGHDDLVGRWELPSGAALVVHSDGGQLVLEPDGQQAFALLHTGRDDDSARRSQLAELAATIVRQALDGDVGLAYKAFDGSVSHEECEQLVQEQLGGLAESIGGVQELDVLGTVPPAEADMPPGFLVSYLRLKGPAGTRGLGLGWMNDRLAGFDEHAPAGTTPVFPTGEDAFTTWSLDSPTHLDLLVERDDDGNATALVLTGPGEAVTATRARG